MTSFVRKSVGREPKSHDLMAELRLHFLCVSALSRIRFLVCLEKVKAEHADLVYFNAVRLLSSGKLFKRFTELFP